MGDLTHPRYTMGLLEKIADIEAEVRVRVA